MDCHLVGHLLAVGWPYDCPLIGIYLSSDGRLNALGFGAVLGAQVELGSQLYAALPADSPIIALVQSGDPSRPEANTTAAFSVGFLVACVYLFQAALNREPSTSR